VHLESDPTALSTQAAGPESATLALTELSRAGMEFADFALAQPSLDEVFLALTGHPATVTEAS
jgi:ABC-2 type transport system ATP-binding protein